MAQYFAVTEATVYPQAHVVWRTRAIYSPTLGRELQILHQSLYTFNYWKSSKT